MPNWCVNRLSISGKEELVKKFVEENYESEEQPLSFAKLIPEETNNRKWWIPANEAHVDGPVLKDESGREYKFNWYDWRLKNWGTKWDCSEVSMEDEDGSFVVYDFWTPWGTPDAWLQAIAEKYPELTMDFSAYEPGCDFIVTGSKGEGTDFSFETASYSDTILTDEKKIEALSAYIEMEGEDPADYDLEKAIHAEDTEIYFNVCENMDDYADSVVEYDRGLEQLEAFKKN